jgi:hypothetical protein
LLHHRFQAEGAREVHADAEGRVLRVEWGGAAGPVVGVLGVYAPCVAQARRRFLAADADLATAMAAGSHAAHLLVAGDFNCVLEQRDVLGQAGPQGGGRMQGSTQLAALMAAHGLVDAWRSMHAAGTDPTHVAAHGSTTSAGRIDMWLVPAHLQQQGWVQRCGHVHGQLPGDHAAVDLRLADPAAAPQGPGMWRLPLECLADPAYVEHLRAAVVAEAGAWVPADDDERAAPARARWEALKLAVQWASVQWEHRQCQQRRQAARRAAAQLEVARRGVVQSAGAAPAVAAYRARAVAAGLERQHRQMEQHRRLRPCGRATASAAPSGSTALAGRRGTVRPLRAFAAQGG